MGVLTDGPLVSVVVPVRNGEGAIRAGLDALAGRLAVLDGGHEVVVVDDGSDDASAQEAARIALHLPGVRVIPVHPHRGVGYAARLGLRSAGGRLRVLLPLVEGDALPPSTGAWEGILARLRHDIEAGGAALVVGRASGVVALDAPRVAPHVEAAQRHGPSFVEELIRLVRRAGLTVVEVADAGADPRLHPPGPPVTRVLKGMRDFIVELHWPWAGVE